VVGGGNSAAADALYLSRLAERVTLLHRRDTLRAERRSRDALLAAENVDFLWNSAVRALEKGEEGVLLTVENTETGEQSRLLSDGVFVSIGRRPATALFREELLLDEEGYIVADETTKTNLPGVYAVGDVRQKPLRQIVTAVGDGAVAAHYAEEFLSGV
jgi:thioredoxin reductase (NADPH)